MERFTVVKTARITIETDTVMVVRHARTARAWCPECHGEVEVISLDNASVAESGAAAQLQEWISAGKLHVWQPAEGSVQICLASLLHCFELNGLSGMRIAKEAT
jgi:hypothetical protein